MWHQARHLVHGSSQKPSEALLRRRLSHTCTNEVRSTPVCWSVAIPLTQDHSRCLVVLTLPHVSDSFV